jgi:hypothetical protein
VSGDDTDDFMRLLAAPLAESQRMNTPAEPR